MKLCDLGHPLRLGSGVRDGSVGRDGGDGRGGEGWLDGSGSRAIISPRLQPQLSDLCEYSRGAAVPIALGRGATVNIDARNRYLDRAERALQTANGGRRQGRQGRMAGVSALI